MIKPLSAADPAAVETLLDAAFGRDRHGRTAYRMREGCTPIAGLSFSAWDGDRLIGTLQSWPVAFVGASGTRMPLVMVGPVAVLPSMQRSGTGRALMEALISAADGLGEAGVAGAGLIMIGDPGYYGRFWDFSADPTGAWEVPGPVDRWRLLARGVVPHHAGVILPDPDR